MPTFSGYSNLDIDVDDFLNECTEHDIEKIIEVLRDDGHLKSSDIKTPDSLPSMLFTELLTKLNSVYLQLSQEDIETLQCIANKY